MEKGTIAAIVIIVGAFLGLGAYFGYSEGWFTGKNETVTPPATQPPQVIVINPPAGSGSGAGTGGNVVTPPATDDTVPVEDLRASAKNKFTMATDATGNISFYSVGADVSDPYVLSLDAIDMSTGSSTALVVQTNSPYDIYYDGEGATNYDEKIKSWSINYNPETGKGTLLFGGTTYYSTNPVGAFVDVDTSPSSQTSCFVDGGTDTANYSEGNCGDSIWFQLDIGNANANTELQQVVMCFRDADGDMEGNEVTAVTASYVSGSTAISIPGSLQQYWEDAMGGGSSQCIVIANLVGSSQKARWEFSFTVTEGNLDATEEFEITFDDLGDYLAKQYPSRNAKATAETLTVQQAA